MRKLINLILGIVLLLSATGCYVQKPTGYVSEPDYNKRVTVAQAGMVKRSTPIGVTFKIGIIGAGAYGGYASQLIKYQSGSEQKSVDWANTALGAMAGVGVNTLIDLISGKGKEKPVYEINKWIRKANKDYIFLNGSNNKFSLMHPSAERNFSVQTIQDVYDFNKLFPKSTYSDKLVLDATKNLQRSDLITLISLYPNNQKIIEAEKQYILLSTSIDDLVKASKLYSNTGLDVERISFDRIVKYTDALQFNKNFEKSKYTNDAFVKGIKECNINDYPYFIANFKGGLDTIRQLSKERYVKLYPKTVAQAYEAGKLYPEFMKLADDKAFAIAYNEQTDDNFENYLRYFSNKERVENIELKYVLKVGAELFELGSSMDELGLYNFNKRYVNSISKLIRETADIAKNNYNEINNKKYNDFVAAAKITEGSRLVKIIFTTNNEEPAITKIKSVVNMMKDHHIKSYDIGNLIGITNPDKGGVFSSIDNALTYYDRGVINASWYRAGTQKTGEMLELTFNSGFQAFEKAFNSFAASNGINIEYCGYLGSYSSDERMNAEREQARIDYRHSQCEKCDIDWKKSESPSDVEHWLWGTVHETGKIVMKNGEEYEFDIYKGKLTISTGWFSSKEFDSYQEMIDEFLEKCQNKYCN